MLHNACTLSMATFSLGLSVGGEGCLTTISLVYVLHKVQAYACSICSSSWHQQGSILPVCHAVDEINEGRGKIDIELWDYKFRNHCLVCTAHLHYASCICICLQICPVRLWYSGARTYDAIWDVSSVDTESSMTRFRGNTVQCNICHL